MGLWLRFMNGLLGRMTRMKVSGRVNLVSTGRVVFLLIAAVPAQGRGQATAPGTVSLEQFQQLSWLVGRWRGSGRFVAAFYEQYRFRNDSTIAMTAYTDSTFQIETADSSVIEWRNGHVRSRTARATNEVIDFAPTRIRFRRVGATDGGTQFERLSATAWTATVYPRGTSTDTTVLQLCRWPCPGR